MEIGIAFNLRSDFRTEAGAPDDALEEYDSEATVAAIERALAKRGHRTRRLGAGRALLASLLEAPCELVFNIAEGAGSRSREAHVPAVLEMLGIPYTHSDPLTMAASLDKAVGKRIVAACGVPTPRFAVVEERADLARIDLGYPLFAKPLFEGSSMGIRTRSRVENGRELESLVGQLLADYREPVLVEEYCSGPEFTIAILGTGRSARVFGTMEIRPKQVAVEEFVYSLEVKRSDDWRELMEYHVPPKRPAQEVAAIERVALDAYRALGCRDVGRVDVRVGADGEPKFLELNPLPGLSPGWSDLALLCGFIGCEYDDLIAAILTCARERLAL